MLGKHASRWTTPPSLQLCGTSMLWPKSCKHPSVVTPKGSWLKSALLTCPVHSFTRPVPFITEGSRGRDSSRNMEECSSLAYSACVLTEPRTTCLGMALPTVDWACPHQLAVKIVSHRHGHRQIWWWCFLIEVPFTLGTVACVILTNTSPAALPSIQ